MTNEIKLREMPRSELNDLVQSAWKEAKKKWSNPSIPDIKAAITDEDFSKLGEHGKILEKQFAFMDIRDFKTYLNLRIIDETFDDKIRGLNAIPLHEAGHRFCPYDKVTAFFLQNKIQKTIGNVGQNRIGIIMNYFTDFCINTPKVLEGDKDLVYVYQQLSKDKASKSSLVWQAYVSSMENLWNVNIFEKDFEFNTQSKNAGSNIYNLFLNKKTLNSSFWEESIGIYANILNSLFEEDEKNNREKNKSQFSINSKNGNNESASGEKNSEIIDYFDKKVPQLCDAGSRAIPTDEEIKELIPEIIKRITKIGPDGLPKNTRVLNEFRDIMAGIGEGNSSYADKRLYEEISKPYVVKFATKPFGAQRESKYSLATWAGSDPTGALDIQTTIMTSGVAIPGATTKKWLSKISNKSGGEIESIPNLDIFIDSSASMPNPRNEISIPILAGFVAARRAIKHNGVRCVNYSYKAIEQNRTLNLDDIYKNLILYQNGGTIFPVKELLDQGSDDPKMSLIITDTFMANMSETIKAIKELRKRHKDNRVTIYAITNLPNANELRLAGAETIHGTTPNIFKHIIGKTEKAYLK